MGLGTKVSSWCGDGQDGKSEGERDSEGRESAKNNNNGAEPMIFQAGGGPGPDKKKSNHHA